MIFRTTNRSLRPHRHWSEIMACMLSGPTSVLLTGCTPAPIPPPKPAVALIVSPAPDRLELLRAREAGYREGLRVGREEAARAAARKASQAFVPPASLAALSTPALAPAQAQALTSRQLPPTPVPQYAPIGVARQVVSTPIAHGCIALGAQSAPANACE